MLNNETELDPHIKEARHDQTKRLAAIVKVMQATDPATETKRFMRSKNEFAREGDRARKRPRPFVFDNRNARRRTTGSKARGSARAGPEAYGLPHCFQRNFAKHYLKTKTDLFSTLLVMHDLLHFPASPIN
ncbi:hypothetical protein AUJ65_06165 [Candidatus Micrarchaeota archaeon CG1_02_51_15]|nr:MAG: hypothetical protein AUJ65_06165 [Candidatus Micrarchaeota archaeon CG1_02_51_15]